MPEPALRGAGPMSRKIFRKRLKYGSPGLQFGAFWGSVGPAGAALGDVVDAFGFNRQCSGSVFLDFDGKVFFVDFDALPNVMGVCACQSEQVGASGAPKSHSSGQKWTRGARWEQPGQSSWPCRFGLAVKVVGRTGNQPPVKSSRSESLSS